MTEESPSVHRRPDINRFISKHSWRGKKTSNDDAQAKAQNQKAIEDDVMDFLKPSINKAQGGPKAPKIDIAAAQRWPSAQDLKKVSPGLNSSLKSPEATRTKRRKNLTVAFAKTIPVIIGEGGDEAEAPPSEVGKLRAEHNRQDLKRTSTQTRHQPSFPPKQNEETDPDFRPAPIKRANTSFGELSQPVQDRMSPPVPLPIPQSPPRMGIKRAPTGLVGVDDGIARPSLDESLHESIADTMSIQESIQEEDESYFQAAPLKRIDTAFSAPEEHHSATPHSLPPRLPEMKLAYEESPIDMNKALNQFLESEPSDPNSFSARVQQKMKSEEGRVLQQFPQDPSALISQDNSRPSTANSGIQNMSGLLQRNSSQGSQNSRDPRNASFENLPARQPSAASKLRHMHVEENSHADYSPSSISASSYSVPSVQSRHPDSAAAEVPPPVSLRAPPHDNNIVAPLPSPRIIPPNQPSNTNFSRPSPISRERPSPTPRDRPTPPPHAAVPLAHDASPQHSNTLPANPVPRKNPGTQMSQDEGMHLVHTAPDPGLHFVSPSAEKGIHAFVPPSPGWAMTPGGFAGDSCLQDFADRVTHMRGIFRLTAEIEWPLYDITPLQWLRASMWWFLKARAGLEIMIRNKPRTQDGRPDMRTENLLNQGHVDLAKCWWIVTDLLQSHPMLRRYGPTGISAQAAQDAGDLEMAEFYELMDIVLANLNALAGSMSRNHIMPPHQSLIQGQDQSIWIRYPHYASDVQAVISGNNTSRSLFVDGAQRGPTNPLLVMPLADTKNDFSYGRIFVQVSLTTDDTETDRVPVPCVLSIMRGKSDFCVKFSICSQTEMITISVQNDARQGLTWQDVQWKTKTRGMYIRLPRDFTLNVDFSDQDFRTLWNIYDYTKKVEASLHPKEDEKLISEVTLRDFQYSDSINPHVFPPERVKRCRARIFEKVKIVHEGTGERQLHRGYRFLIVTSPKSKTLSSVSNEFDMKKYMDFEFLTDPSGDRTPALIFRITEPEKKRKVTIFMAFNDVRERGALYGQLNGMTLGPDEMEVAQMPLKGITIEQAEQGAGFVQSGNDPLKRLHWQDLRVINSDPIDPNTEHSKLVLSESLRIVSRHSSGSFTDRLNMSPGEMLVRLTVSNSAELTLLRQPQDDATTSLNPKAAEPTVPDALRDLIRSMITTQTLRTYAFQTLKDLHVFQQAITGFSVKYDGIASTFGISRRRMVVPIYKRWEASTVRIQIVQSGSVYQLLAFFEDFTHADSMNFQIKSMDVFERTKSGGKYAVRFVDAKFALPAELRKGESRALRERFVCLDLPEYPGEHDDITVGFDNEPERDRFSNALPAATQESRPITLRRRI
ncbi:hypothetical protein M501DRAFT_1002018 [Patellaria atrata CBS 101060]|uniref:Uncharacterized protein n=1 Tax=Patellaria atrata CBS 101060 TaxID=1346257 RepID=A0A9P4SE05_9PEZI|nr:hypothetical protein M501DRAFT_1002018 [Patellaria atrata CBS 101060]